MKTRGFFKITKGFLCEDGETSSKKTDFILGSGKEKLHLVLDFDRTLTRGADKAGNDITTWHILQRHISKAGQTEYWKLYNKYRPLEAQNKLTIPQAIKWWSSVLNIYQDNKLKWQDIVLEVKSAMPPRAGVKELFNICEEKNIPAIIISAGIKDLIELWCQRHVVRPAQILSTNLYFDADGIVCGWNKDSLIHALNKKEKGHKELIDVKKNRPNVILVSDSIHDAHMIEGGLNSLKILIDDIRSDDLPRSNDFYKKIFKNFDLVINTGSFLPVVKFLRSI